MKLKYQILFGTLIIAINIVYWLAIYTPLKAPYEIEINVSQGVAPTTLVDHLADEDTRIFFPPFRWVYSLYARWHYRNKPLQAGTYTIEPSDSFRDWIIKFQKGLPRLYSITIPEGLTFHAIATRLSERGLLDDKEAFITLATSSQFLTSQGILSKSVEGYLFPSTYKLPLKYPARRVLTKMISMFRNAVETFSPKTNHLYMRSVHDYLTLASIIEKETGVGYERDIIAGVFHNRMDRGMKLQSDPTTIYGLGKFGARLTTKDLRTKTAYNTYVIPGLPPGPICNPGLDSIKAAYHPKKHSYIFFVSKNDGSHVFSETNSEHEQYVDIYQRKKTKSL